MQAATQQLQDTSKLQTVRRGIARVRTLHGSTEEPTERPTGMNEQANTPAADAQPAKKAIIQTLTGRVVSDKMNKTVTVLVERRVKHQLYGKIVMKSAKYHAHDETNECKEGDLVEIAATRKLSKTKAWRVSNILEKAQPV